MSKSEKYIVTGIVVCIALGVIAWMIFDSFEFADGSAAAKSQTSDAIDERYHSMNEVVPLEGTGFEGDGVPWWNGLLEMTVKSAELYESPEDVGISTYSSLEDGIAPDEKARFKDGSNEFEKDAAFLVCTVEINNVNAVPSSTSYSDNYWFNISFLTINPYFEITYFDGTPSNADPSGHDGLCFDLQEGNLRFINLGFLAQKAHWMS